MKKISVIIPSYNAQHDLPATIDALKRQSIINEVEILVVDCSDTDAVEVLCAERGVTCHKEAKRFNPGIGRNIGAKLALGELLVFVDSDVWLEPDALEQAWMHYKNGNLAFGGALELNEQVQPSIASYLEHYFFNHESQKGRSICPRSNLSSALMVLDKQLFIQNGGFKDIPRMQDTEMTERLIKKGVSLSFNPAIVGLQIQDSPLSKVLKKIFINGRNLFFIRYQKQNLVKKVVLFLLLPLITAFKMLRIIARHLRYQTSRQKGITLLISPLLCLGGVYWMLGIYRSMIFGGGISTKRD